MLSSQESRDFSHERFKVIDIGIIDKLLIMYDGRYNIVVTSHFNKRSK